MAAPKQWGYTREHPIGDELLVSWADGDLTKAVARELEERALTHGADRKLIADYARACQATVTPHAGPDRLASARSALADRCRALGVDEAEASPLIDASVASGRSAQLALPRVAFGTLLSAAVWLGLSALAILWMLRHLG